MVPGRAIGGNGNLLIYDNFGFSARARVLEYNFRNNTYPWSYGGENSVPMVAGSRGMKQRLGNGNTIMLDPDSGRILEVTQSKQVVWEFGIPSVKHDKNDNSPQGPCAVPTYAYRYSPDQLPFLKGNAHARP